VKRLLATMVRVSGSREPVVLEVEDDAADNVIDLMALAEAERLSLARPSDPVNVIIVPRLLKDVCVTVTYAREAGAA